MDSCQLKGLINTLAYRFVQIVVQSRNCKLWKTEYLPSASDDMLWLTEPELDAIGRMTRDTLGGSPYESLMGTSLCIEFTMESPYGEQMVMEIWEFRLSGATTPYKTSGARHDRLIQFLKSVLQVTRAVPLFRLARVPTMDTFKLHCLLYMGPIKTNHGGDCWRSVEFGACSIEAGTVSASVRFRKNLIMTDKERKAWDRRVAGSESHYVDRTLGPHYLDKVNAVSVDRTQDRPSRKDGCGCATSPDDERRSQAHATRRDEPTDRWPTFAFASEPEHKRDPDEHLDDLLKSNCDMFANLLVESARLMPVEETDEDTVALSEST